MENGKKPQMIAHRGLSGFILENTSEAFELAGQKSYYGIETDVHVTNDGEYIVFHDDDLRRIVGIDGVIEESNYADLRALRFKDPYRAVETPYRLPSLKEYYDVCKKYNKRAVLELKNRMTTEQVLGIAKAVEEFGWLDQTTFISFSGENLLDLRKAYPNADAQFLVCEWTEEGLNFMLENRLGGDVEHVFVKKEYVDRMHKAGLTVNCWTVDKKEDADRVTACGVDQITSNILE